MSSNTPIKRKRTADTVAEAEGPIARSTRFWFDDGNVILQSENTQFRVHRSILATHSEIMKNCFSFVQPDDAPAVDGCPLVLMPDSAKDIDNLCAILYGMYHVDVDGIDGSFVTTMLRMGFKYEIAFFKKSAQNCLRPLFPTTLDQWNGAQKKVQDIISRNKGFLFDVINVAHGNHFSTILPAAFLSLYIHHSLDEIITGVKDTANILANR
ncbi:hypothetical protein HYPSUDRAFT_198909 [Hypholoma sublateritium FD-334 SS-4]|uniref:BTB domain-containing protein n=1 Tax=Hypholoma sublateritium (strain FD-334 SS-4) TaxID=945553 RepID=A0A0D2PDP9_HYPSF|nr:hypothetical protein HYPSUDRAFT_198909 [Hypholoma sublateritium FD-334 SS-4]